MGKKTYQRFISEFIFQTVKKIIFNTLHPRGFWCHKPIRRTLLPPSFVMFCLNQNLILHSLDLQLTSEDLCWLWKCFFKKKHERTSWFQAMILRHILHCQNLSSWLGWSEQGVISNSHENLWGKNIWGNMLVQKKTGLNYKKEFLPPQKKQSFKSQALTSPVITNVVDACCPN